MLFYKLRALFSFISLLVLVSATPKDVFLSFRGAETRAGFIGHLFIALTEAGISTFMDEEGIPKGENIYSEIERAINESKISMILFSEDFATSTYCLDEVEMIMERRRTVGLYVVPIFYMVSTSQVRKQTGTYGQAFAEHEKQFKGEIHKVEKWRDALREVTDLAGMPYKDSSSEVEFIKEIVEVIRYLLNYTAWSPPVVEKELNDKVMMKLFLLFILLSLPLILICRVCLFGRKDYVFVSIGGKDTEDFTFILSAALIQSGIHTYRDHPRIKRSENNMLKIRKAINTSKISVVVFSKDYAYSEHCLDQLLQIMERKRTYDEYIVVPIFFYVNPSEVQEQTGAYRDAFARHQNKFKAGQVKKWTAALKEATKAADEHEVTLPDKCDATCIQDIVKKIEKRLNKTVKIDCNSLYFSWIWVSYILEKLLNNIMVRLFAEAILLASPKGENKNNM